MWEKIRQNWILLLLLLTGAVYFFLEYISPLIAPVLTALLFVTIFGPFLKKVQARFHIHRQLGAVLLLIAALLLFAGLVWILVFWIVGSLPGWIGSLKAVEEQLQILVHNLCIFLGQLVGVDGVYLENAILRGISQGINALGQHTLPGMMSQSLEYVKVLGAVGGFLVTFLISTILLAKDYDDIMNRLLDRRECHVFLEVICGVTRYIATFVRAQVVIMSVIGLTAAAGLTAARIPNGILWGILAGMLDALPFIGTGVVLMPLAVSLLVQGGYGQAVVCVVVYVICIFERELLEPRLIGRRMGVPPIAVLLSLYVGIQLFGLWGILKGPLGFVLIRESYLSIRRMQEMDRKE